MTAKFSDALAAIGRTSPRTAPDRRRHRRVALEVSGKLLTADGIELACRTIDLSPGGVSFTADGRLRPGDQIVLYLDRLGRTPALLVRSPNTSHFAAQLVVGLAKKERIAEELTFLLNEQRFGLEREEERRTIRYAGHGGQTTIELDDGSQLSGEIIDFSLVGMAVKMSGQRPDIGRWVRVGSAHGRIARFIPGGFCVDFEPRRSGKP
jgi:c-di-GMP-binding flagellar brake protein YcgR